jgi:hypothetical protein
MNHAENHAEVLRYGFSNNLTSVSSSASTENGSKSADLVQILAVCTKVARSTEGGQRRISMPELSACAAEVDPFSPLVTVRLLPDIAVTSICSVASGPFARPGIASRHPRRL